jgi:hypothetical protein
MSTEPSQNKPSTLFGFINSAFGKTIIFVTFATTVFTAFKLLGGDTRLAIIVLCLVGTGTLFLGSLYIFFKKNEIRSTSFKTGLKIQKGFVYTKGQRYVALAVLASILILWGIGLLYTKRTPHGEITFVEALTGKNVNVEGFILTAGGEPADKALVTLFLNEKATETKEAVDGKFSFTSVDISELGLGAMRIEAKWKNLESNLSINLSTDQLNNLVIKLPAGPPPFKVDYFMLEGPAIDFLVRGQIDKRWEERLAGQPTIVMNNVFNDLKNLLSRFSAPFKGQFFEVSNSKAKAGSQPVRDYRYAARNENKPFLFGGIQEPPRFAKVLTREEFIAMLSTGQKWHLTITPERGSRPKGHSLYNFTSASFHFWRFGTPDDVKFTLQDNPSLEVREVEFYSYIISNYLPPDFFLFEMYLNPPGLGCGDPVPAVWLGTRSLKLRIALLENISDNPIRIGKFLIKENNLNRLRDRDEDRSMLAAKSPEQKTFYPSEFLKPKEKLVIPIELLLAYDADDTWAGLYTELYTRGTSPKVLAELSEANQINLPYEGGGAPVEVSASVLADMSRTPMENPELEKEFVFGSSSKIESLDVDGVNYPFRSLDTRILVMNGGNESGSCPYVFTYTSESNSWINEGTILRNLDGKLKESTDEKELSRFNGSILLTEMDPETSFIDQIYIRALNHNGSQQILSPKSYQLRYGDCNYLVLKQGDQKRIDFNVLPSLDVKRFVLVAKGYYIPYSKRK